MAWSRRVAKLGPTPTTLGGTWRGGRSPRGEQNFFAFACLKINLKKWEKEPKSEGPPLSEKIPTFFFLF